MELLDNEYHLIGPGISPTKPNGCSLDCKGRTMDDTSRRQNGLDDHRNDVCRCKRFLRRDGPSRDARLPREQPPRRFIDENSIAEPKFHSTEITTDETNNADYQETEEFDTEEVLPSCDCNDTLDIRDDQREITRIRETGRRDEPIPGPSRDLVRPIPARNAKETRLEDRIVQRADENDEETTEEEEEDMDCTCDTNGVTRITRDEPSRRRPRDRIRVVVRDQRNGHRRENNEEEDEEDEERTEEEDEDTEDSAYRELRARSPRRRTTARERELKRWIRRCRQECERRRRAR